MLVEKLPIAAHESMGTPPAFQRGIAWRIIICPYPDQAIGHDWLDTEMLQVVPSI
jgi:hypothetical protein